MQREVKNGLGQGILMQKFSRDCKEHEIIRACFDETCGRSCQLERLRNESSFECRNQYHNFESILN